MMGFSCNDVKISRPFLLTFIFFSWYGSDSKRAEDGQYSSFKAHLLRVIKIKFDTLSGLMPS